MLISDLYKIYQKYNCISTDTRHISKDSIFFALKGASFNGNTFALQALNKGAAFAVVDEDIKASHSKIIKVDDVLKTLQLLATYHREQLNIPIIAITGTNGKTTSKELLREVLSTKYRTLATEGNLNNHIGVPLTLLKIIPEHEIAIIEMGANHLGEIDELCQIALPDYGLITNVGLAHLEGFGSFENIVTTKTDLYRAVEKRKGTVFVRQEHSILLSHIKSKSIRYSYKDMSASVVGTGKIDNNRLLIHLTKAKTEINKIIHTQLLGLYNTENILSAITIGLFFDVTINDAISSIEAYQPKNNRSQILSTDKNQLILDAYNANPSSLGLAIENFASLKESDKVLILGDMFELGDVSFLEHQKIIELLSTHSFNRIFLLGPCFSKVAELKKNKIVFTFKTTEDFIQSGKIKEIKNAWVLLKGSRGMQLEKLVSYL